MDSLAWLMRFFMAGVLSRLRVALNQAGV